jgi:hypothetical protein
VGKDDPELIVQAVEQRPQVSLESRNGSGPAIRPARV